MINPLFRLFCCAVLLVISSPLLAAPPSSAQVNQLLEAGRAGQTHTNITAYIVQTVWQELENELTERTSLSKTDIDVINVTLGSSLVKALSWEKMKPHYQRLYARSLNAEQAQALLQFYHSPVGQILIMAIEEAVKRPEFMENPKAIEPIIEQAISNVDEKYLREFLQLEQTHGVLQLYMTLFTDSVELLQEQAAPVMEAVIEEELTKALTR